MNWVPQLSGRYYTLEDENELVYAAIDSVNPGTWTLFTITKPKKLGSGGLMNWIETHISFNSKEEAFDIVGKVFE